MRPDVFLSPAAGQDGDTIAVRADGFNSGEFVDIYVDGRAVAAPYSGDGTLGNGNTTFTIPRDVAPGPHTVRLHGRNSDHTVQATLRVFALTVAPTQAAPGGPMTLGGAGFTPSETVAVTLGAALVTLHADGSGMLGSQVLDIPLGTAAGALPITGTGTAGEQATAGIQVVAGALSLNRTSAPPGATLTLAGDGYSSETVNIYEDGQYLDNVYTGDGRLNKTVTLPASYAPGDHVISAVGTTSGHALTTHVREYAARVAPQAGAPGDTVHVSGGGFTPGRTVDVDFGGLATASATSGGDGGFDAALTVPGDAPAATYPITASDAAGEVALTSFRVSAATLTLAPTNGLPDGTVTYTFTGFQGDSTVDLTYNGAYLGAVGVRADGSNQSSFRVPDTDSAGPVDVVARGRETGNVAEAAFLVNTAIAPMQPAAAPGTTVGVTGDGFSPNEGVSLLLDGAPGQGYPIGHGSAGPDGSIASSGASFVVPASTHGSPVGPGSHRVYAYGATSHALVYATFRVLSPALSFAPGGAQPGAPFNASAGGFQPSETVLFYWDGDNTTGTYLGSSAANCNYYCYNPGYAGPTLHIPAGAAPGQHTVTAYGLASGTTLEGVITVVTLDATPAIAAPSSMVTLTARGYTPGESVDLSFSPDNGGHIVTVGSAVAGPDGVATSAVIVPTSIRGAPVYGTTAGQWYARGRSGGYSANRPFTVLAPPLTLAPGGAQPGARFNASAGAFYPSESVLFYWDGDATTGTYLGSGTTNCDYYCYNPGGISLGLTVPAGATPGTHTLYAYGVQSGQTVTGTIRVLTLALAPASGVAGTGGTATVAGYGPSERVTLLWDGTSAGNLAAGSGLTDSSGSATIPFSVPANANGPVGNGGHTIYAVGRQTGFVTSASFLVNPAALALSPATVGAGATVNAAASGFAPSESVHFYWDGDNTQGRYLGATVTNCASYCYNPGGFSANLTIPSNAAAGPHTISSYGESSGAVLTGTVDVINATLTTSSPSAAPGSALDATASGFGPGEQVSFLLDGDDATGRALVTSTTTGAGTTGPIHITVPAATTPGVHALFAYGATTKSLATGRLVVSGVAVTATAAQPNDGVTVSGAGFGNESVDILFDGYNLSSPYAGDGVFAQGVTVPSWAAPGRHTLTAAGQSTGLRYSTTLLVAGLTLTPSQVKPGGSVQVGGYGFAPDEGVALYLDGPRGPLLGSARETATGLAPTTVTLPADTVPGSYAIYGVGDSGLLLHGIVTVGSGSLTLSPGAGQAGDPFVASGSGFGSETVNIYLDGAYLDNQSVNGGLYKGLTIPGGATPGPHTLKATGANTGVTLAGTLRVYQATVTPAQGAPGTSLTIAGAGFTPNEAITATLGLGDGATTAHTTTNGAGAVRAATLTIPRTAAPGIDTLTLVGDGGEQATTSVRVTAPALGVSPGATQAGDAVTISGDGFNGGENVRILLDNGQFDTASTDGSGHFAKLVTVPAGYAGGAHTVMALGDNSGRGISAPLRILTVRGDGTAQAGAAFAIAGAGFTPNGAVTFYWNGDKSTGQAAGSTIASATGLFSASVTIPTDAAPGSYPLVAYDAGSRATASLTVQVVTTAAGATGSLTVQFPSVQPGGYEAVNGSGLQPSETYVVRLDGATGGGSVDGSGLTNGFGTAGGDGRFSFNLNIHGDVGPGQHTVTVTGLSSGNNLSGSFAVTQARVASPIALPNGSIHVFGVGFTPNETVDATLGGDTLFSLVADGAGSLDTTTIRPPDLAAGAYTLALKGRASGYAATAGLELGDGALTVTPGGARSGSRVTIGAAYDFLPGEGVLFYLDGDRSTGVYLGRGDASCDYYCYNPGSISVNPTLPVLSSGPHTVYAYGVTSGSSVQGTVRVTALRLAPAYGKAGTPVAVTGGGFAPGEQVDIYFNGDNTHGVSVTSALASTDVTGALSSAGFSFTVPISLDGGPTAPGAYAVYAYGEDSHTTAVDYFNLSSLTVSPAGAAPGQSFKVSGGGFTPSETVLFYLDGSGTDGAYLGQVGANCSYYCYQPGFYNATLTVPGGTPAGPHTLYAYGEQSGSVISATVGVVSAALAKTNVYLGDTVGVSGAGFLADEPIGVYLDGSGTDGTLIGGGAAGPDGSFAVSDVTFTVPISANGSPTTQGVHQVFVYGAAPNGHELVRNLALNVGAPTLSLDPSSGQGGARIHVVGAGFTPSERVRLSIGPDKGHAVYMGLGTANCASYCYNSDGLDAYANVPAGLPLGPTTIFAEGQASGFLVSAPFIVTGITLRPDQTYTGQQVSVDGDHFGPGETVSIFLDSTSSTALISGATDSNGSFRDLRFTLPDGTSLGDHTVYAMGATSGTQNSATLHVIAPPPTDTPRPTSTATPTPGETATPTGTATNVPPSATPTGTATPTPESYSDNFPGPSLNGFWTWVPGGAAADAYAFSRTGLDLTSSHTDYTAAARTDPMIVHQTYGDWTAEAQVAGTPATDGDRVGLMVSDPADPTRYWAFAYGHGTIAVFDSASSDGSPSGGGISYTGGQPYLKVTRSGDTYTFSYSADGNTFTRLYQGTYHVGPTVKLALYAQGTGDTFTGTILQAALNAPLPGARVPAAPTSTRTPRPTRTPTSTPTVTNTPGPTDTPTQTPIPTDTPLPGPPSVQGVTTSRNAGTTPSYYTPGDAAVISATVLTSYGGPAGDAAVSATVSMTSPSNPPLATLDLVYAGNGVYTGTIAGADTTLPGFYVVTVRAARPGVGAALYPGYGSFVVSRRTLSLSRLTFPGAAHQGNVDTVSGGVYNRGFVPDRATVALDDVDATGAVLHALGTRDLPNLAARQTGAFSFDFDTTTLGVGAHHLRLRLLNLSPDQDPAATAAVTEDIVVTDPLPNMGVSPDPAGIAVAAGDTASAIITVTNGAKIATLTGVTATFTTANNPGAQIIPWLALSTTSLGDIAAGGAAGVTITASSSSSVVLTVSVATGHPQV